MTYVADPANPSLPLDGDDASGGAAELRALKGYLQGLITGGASLTSYAWQGFRNKFVNPRMDIFQASTSATSASLVAGTGKRYIADQWYTNSTGSTIAPSVQPFVLGQTDVPNEPAWYHRCVVASVAGAANLAVFGQYIEGVRTGAGIPCSLSFWAKADAPKSITVEVAQNFGTGGAPSATVNAIGVTKLNLTTSWQRFVVGLTPPSIAGKTLGTDETSDNLEVIFWMDAGSNFNARTDTLGQQSGTFDFAELQFETTGYDTAIEIRPRQVELELALRYLFVSYANNLNTSPLNLYQMLGQSTTHAEFPQKFPVVMRATPTVTLVNFSTGTNNQVRWNAANLNVTSLSNVDKHGIYSLDVAAGGAANTPAIFHIIATARY